MSVEPTLQAALNLTARLRELGPAGNVGVRVRQAGWRYELVVEDRTEPGDEVHDARGIRFYLGAETATTLASVVLDVEGQDFVLRPSA